VNYAIIPIRQLTHIGYSYRCGVFYLLSRSFYTCQATRDQGGNAFLHVFALS